MLAAMDKEPIRIVTLQAHILGEQARHPHASGTLSWILSALSISAKIIADKVRRARLENVLGSVGTENVQGEVQQKLDVIANDVLLRTLGGREGVAIVASEENEEPVICATRSAACPATACCSIRSTAPRISMSAAASAPSSASVARPPGSARPRFPAAGGRTPGGRRLCNLWLIHRVRPDTRNGVDMFVLDPGIGAFMRVERNLKIPARGTRPTRSTRAIERAFPKAISATSIGRRATATRAATRAPWWRTSTGFC